MAGRPLLKVQRELQAERIAAAKALPTERRTTPEPYSDKLISELLELSRFGFTLAEIADHWAISEETLQEWKEAHTDFAEALLRARTGAKAWWQRQAREALAEQNNKFPAGAWSHAMRAMFPEYDDKKGVTIQFDLTRLVMLDLAGLPSERVVADHNALANQGTVKLGHGLTPSGELESETVLEGEIVGRRE